jgi:integrase/recombinase XerD
MDLWAADLAAFRHWWLYEGDKPRRESTLEGYERQLRRWKRWCDQGHHPQPEAPTIVVVRGYIGEVRATHGEHSAFAAVAALKAFGRFLADHEMVPEDPLKGLKHPKVPEPKRTPTAELDEIEAMLATCTTGSLVDVRDRAILCLLRATGMRRSEVAGMRWEQLDLAECTVTLISGTTKSGKARVAYFDQEAQRAIRQWVRLFKSLPAAELCEHVWVSDRGHFGLRSDSLGKMINRRAKRAGIDVTTHSFRRGLNVRWLRSGRSETLLMTAMGWTTPKMIGVYARAVRGEETARAWRELHDEEAKRRRRRSA